MIGEIKHLTMEELEAGLDEIRRAPKDEGVLQLIVRRPQVEEREILEEGELHLQENLPRLRRGRRLQEVDHGFGACLRHAGEGLFHPFDGGSRGMTFAGSGRAFEQGRNLA